MTGTLAQGVAGVGDERVELSVGRRPALEPAGGFRGLVGGADPINTLPTVRIRFIRFKIVPKQNDPNRRLAPIGVVGVR